MITIFQDDPTLLFALNGLGSLNAMLQNIDKALQYFKMVIDCVNGFILNGETSIISSSLCDIYSEYVILHDMHKLDLKKAKKDVNAFFDSINKPSSKNMSKSELIYILVSKTNAMWLFQNYQECIGTMEKVLKILRKNREQQGDLETPVLQLQLLYQIAKGITYVCTRLISRISVNFGEDSFDLEFYVDLIFVGLVLVRQVLKHLDQVEIFVGNYLNFIFSTFFWFLSVFFLSRSVTIDLGQYINIKV